VSFIDSTGSMPRAVRWLLGKVLPTIVSNADREELTMTALGAGTALSTLHTFGRAVLLLHGHKHFPTARLLRGLVEESGDVLVASAGSGGKRERLHGTHDPDAVRLWPSFNVVRIEGERVTIESVSFSPKKSTRRAVRRDLAMATRRDHRWEPTSVSARVRDITKRVERDEARFVLSPSRTGSAATWDYVCERTVVLSPGAKLGRYVEFVPVHAERARIRTRASRRRIDLRTDGVTRYAVSDGLLRRATLLAKARGASQAFEWVGLLSRYGGATVTLAIARAQAEDLAPFGSVTDLSTGREWPVFVQVTADEWSIRLQGCAPRTLLRIYWPLAG
jgi:hypothetical protein